MFITTDESKFTLDTTLEQELTDLIYPIVFVSKTLDQRRKTLLLINLENILFSIQIFFIKMIPTMKKVHC